MTLLIDQKNLSLAKTQRRQGKALKPPKTPKTPNGFENNFGVFGVFGGSSFSFPSVLAQFEIMRRIAEGEETRDIERPRVSLREQTFDGVKP